MKALVPLAVVLILSVCFIGEGDAWSGNIIKVRTRTVKQVWYCICWYRRWGCSRYRWYWSTSYTTRTQCKTGWRHNGDYNCNIPICRPSCQNDGVCSNPNVCTCPPTATGAYCGDMTCSHLRPCYPGDCGSSGIADNCECENGFLFNTLITGCNRFNPAVEEMKPIVGKSNITISNIRRTDSYADYMFILEGSDTEEGETETIWSNQKRFNHLKFSVESYFNKVEDLPERPLYVHDSKLGIVETVIEANVSKYPRDPNSVIRDFGSFKRYPCDHLSQDNPEVELAECTIIDDQFKTLIEHADWLHVAVKTRSGGYQKLITDQNAAYKTQYYQGLQTIKSFQFNFDFIAPKHCSEPSFNGTCPPGATPLKIIEEFTRNPIQPRWLGWTDDLSGIYEYYVEVFLLEPDQYGRLIETEPLAPKFAVVINTTTNIDYPEYRPDIPGMYSVLMETRDTANNSKISRRLVLYDDKSSISLNDAEDGRLFISSAVNETGYMWQTAPAPGTKIRINVSWKKHFINHIHEDNLLLNEVMDYPLQFKDIADDNLLSVKKFVALDDDEGERTVAKIPNYHGMVKFEISKQYTLDDEEPNEWLEITPFKEETSFEETLADGARVRVWIRATDTMGHTRTDSTLMRVDGTGPVVSKAGEQGHQFVRNIDDGQYNYTSSLQFIAKDDQSGVHKFRIKLTVQTPNKEDRVLFEGYKEAKVFDTFDLAACVDIEGKCFIPNQDVHIDNCWFLVNRDDLATSTGSIEVIAYNQALLTTSTSFDVGKIVGLKGLEEYDGPRNFRIESLSDRGFRVAWDLPKEASCYGRATVVIVLFIGTDSDGNPITSIFYANDRLYQDFLGLEPNTHYKLGVNLQTSNSSAMIGEGVSLSVTTTDGDLEGGASTGLIVGVALGVLAIVAIAIIIFAVLVRRGVLAPPREQARRIRKTVRRRVQTIYGGLHEDDHHPSGSNPNYAYDNRQSELYIYGGMDLSTAHDWDIERDDVTFETLIKSGHFANIYKARLRKRNGSSEQVVAKTLKENYSSDDEFLMKAKINFTGQQVGDHPNVLKFVGAVTSNDAMGPFIIYEYCEHGTLKDYLVDNKTNLTIELQENLFRFGLDIAKGMEYLAQKKIVHRRLAARNILLTFVNEVKISGFGPQPQNEEDGDAEKGKKERIPIKWMAPECMESTKDATEKSDVWSYAVVLWEIFSLGETPYTGKGRDIPQRLKKGERLARPEQCDDVWYNVMKKCWEYKPEKRPTFTKVRDELDNLFVAAPGDDYYYYKR